MVVETASGFGIGLRGTLQVRGLTFAFGSRTLWSNVCFDVPAGEVTGILGNNGTGKSTLMNCIAGILKPRAGSVLLDGINLLGLPRRSRAQYLAYVAQRFETSSTSVYDTVLLGRLPYFSSRPSSHDYAVVDQTLEELGIAAWADRDASTLSGGEGQKVMLARAIAQEPRVLLLDEPTASLDLGSRYETLRYVNNYAQSRHVAVLMVSHDVNAALQVCSNLVLIAPDGGVCSTPTSAVTREQFSRTFNVAPHVVSELINLPADG